MTFSKYAISLLLFISPLAVADKKVAMQSGCLGCHQVSIKTVGPAINDIAKKHQATDIDVLVGYVKNGKSNDQLVWGTIPMPPNGASKENIKKVITWMLTHK